MPEAKTKPTRTSVPAFLARFPEAVAKDARVLIAMMRRISGKPPVMWGPSIIGFGSVHYRYASGHEGDTCLVGFSPRKAGFALYLMCAFQGAEGLLKRLGKHQRSVGCLYLKRLADVDLKVLEALIRRGHDGMKRLAAPR
jgi:hypothetical protein